MRQEPVAGKLQRHAEFNSPCCFHDNATVTSPTGFSAAPIRARMCSSPPAGVLDPPWTMPRERPTRVLADFLSSPAKWPVVRRPQLEAPPPGSVPSPDE